NPNPSEVREPHRRRVRVGDRDRASGDPARLRDPVARPADPAPRRAADGASHPGGRPGHRRTRDRLRGGPVFPSMFLGAAAGIAMSHLPGLPLVPGAAMGIGAMCAVMLRLPMTSVLLATLLLGSDGLAVMPEVIVAVAVAYVASAWLTATPAAAPKTPPSATQPALAPAHPAPGQDG